VDRAVSAKPGGSHAPSYRERLWAPVRWWVLCGLLVASLGVAFVVSTPAPVAIAATAVCAALAAGWLLVYGAAQVSVGPDGLRAGRAQLPRWACGDVRELSPAEFRALSGLDADARAYLVMRPYVDRAVRVDVADPLDPTPYWLVATRHPAELAAAVRRARSAA
jgi:hypothetical protein